MKNRIRNAVRLYDKKYGIGSRSKEGQFLSYDFYTLMDMSDGDQYEIASNALKAGFIIGYRKGKADKKGGR